MQAPDFTIIIPHRDDPAGLGRTLAALTALSPASPTFDVIVADNCSTEGMEAHVALVGGCTLDLEIIVVTTPGAGPARNAGAHMARGARIAFLDCDCTPTSDWLCAMGKALDAHDVVGCPVVATLIAKRTEQASAAEIFDLLYGFQSRRSFARDGLLLTANLATTKAVFDAVGPFHTALSEDRDWCERARVKGFRLFLLPEPDVAHVALDDPARLHQRWMRITRETWHFHRAYGGGSFRWLAYCALVAMSPAVHGWRILFAPEASGASFLLKPRVFLLLVSIRWKRAVLGMSLCLRRRHNLG